MGKPPPERHCRSNQTVAGLKPSMAYTAWQLLQRSNQTVAGLKPVFRGQMNREGGCGSNQTVAGLKHEAGEIRTDWQYSSNQTVAGLKLCTMSACGQERRQVQIRPLRD